MKKVLLLSVIASGITSLYAGNNKINKPNVLFILVDDMGYTDLGCTGSTFHETPHIDRLANESVSFNYAYAACPVSSPSRAAIITGKYPARINITDYIPGNQAYGPHKDQMLSSLPFNQHLDIDETGIAEAFRRNGYDTFFTGKWHLSESEKYYPTSFGFDVNVGGNNTGHPAGGYFSPYKNPHLPDGPKGEYLTDRLTDEMIKFLRTKKNRPFFAYLSYYTVHLPMQAKQDKIDKYTKKLYGMSFSDSEFVRKGKTFHKMYQNMPIYAAMVEHLDDNIGRLMECLREEGLDKNTIIVFTSDNGGMATSNTTDNIPTSNSPLRAGKGYLYEGGIKVPLFVRWSGTVKPSVIEKSPVVGTDFYPTLLGLCGLKLLPNQHIDGFSFRSLLEGKGYIRKPIFWHYPHYSGGLGGRPSAAVRYGDYKLIEFFEDNHVELYNVINDISEKNDLSAKESELTDKLKDMLHKWYVEIGAKMPVKNEYYQDM